VGVCVCVSVCVGGGTGGYDQPSILNVLVVFPHISPNGDYPENVRL
jgi:hypothetical protein